MVLMLGWWQPGAARDAPSRVLRDTLLLKDPKGAHVSEAYRYYTEPFGPAPDPERAEARGGPAGSGRAPGTRP